ncbi:5-oxoprolinase subunit PxpB [Algoriphagus chordae]|uniref:KipI family sensor histidine kinase inhibitor n=1 Tax=Algoriphagus chordae TaxID=237019 RepID=A0A2W7R1W7_9BACT|nr:5-oxoprolinase subunit PxpB [Algoriphagus chordae]PZX54171.1 KipI family sensor histidine kinase inhibitor [Algoriphagus chordae]
MKPILKRISQEICEFEWEAAISDVLLQHQLSFKAKLQEDFSTEISELRMGFKTLAILLSKRVETSEIEAWLKAISSELSLKALPARIWQIPVCYSDETGRDLETLAKHKNIRPEELITIHSQTLYRLHFFGFLPGFMYLNGLPEALYASRKSIPDRSVPVGSIAIGGSQTGIYPSSSPGGWHLIGQTPLALFDPSQDNPVFASPGERIEFLPISKLEFDRLTRHPHKPKFR